MRIVAVILLGTVRFRQWKRRAHPRNRSANAECRSATLSLRTAKANARFVPAITTSSWARVMADRRGIGILTAGDEQACGSAGRFDNHRCNC